MLTDIEYRKEILKTLNDDEVAMLVYMLGKLGHTPGEYLLNSIKTNIGGVTANTLLAYFKCVPFVTHFMSRPTLQNYFDILNPGEYFEVDFLEYATTYCIPKTVFSLVIEYTKFEEHGFPDIYQKYKLWEYPEAMMKLKKRYPWIKNNVAIKLIKKINGVGSGVVSVAERNGNRTLRSLKNRSREEICQYISAFDWSHILNYGKLDNDENASYYIAEMIKFGDYCSETTCAKFSRNIDDFVRIADAIYFARGKYTGFQYAGPAEHAIINIISNILKRNPKLKDEFDKERSEDLKMILGKTARAIYEVYSGDLLPESDTLILGENIKIKDLILPVTSMSNDNKERRIIAARAKKFKKAVKRILKRRHE